MIKNPGGFQHWDRAKHLAVARKGGKACTAKYGPLNNGGKNGEKLSVAMQMLRQYKRRLLKGEQEGW